MAGRHWAGKLTDFVMTRPGFTSSLNSFSSNIIVYDTHTLAILPSTSDETENRSELQSILMLKQSGDDSVAFGMVYLGFQPPPVHLWSQGTTQDGGKQNKWKQSIKREMKMDN